MKAIRIHEQGMSSPMRLDAVDEPTCGVGEVMIEVEAAGVNFADLMIRRGVYPIPIEFPFTPGTEVVGRIVAAGSDTDVVLGHRVAAIIPAAGYAEYAVAAADSLIPVGEDDDAGDVLAMLVQGVTASQSLTIAGRLRKGDTTLVHAAAGGVGSLAIQIARHLGARTVIGTTGSASKRKLIEDLGADLVVDTEDPNWVDTVRRHAGAIDVSIDSVGGAVTTDTLGLLRPVTGRLVILGASSGQPSTLDPTMLIGPNTSVVGYSMAPHLGDPDVMASTWQALDEMRTTGAVRPVVEHTFALDDTESAHQLLATRRSIGKIVLIP